LSFFLAPFVLALVLTLATLRQADDRRRLQGLYDELRRAHDQLADLHHQARELAVTQERNRLAREIHDTLAHYLTVIVVQLEAAEKLGVERLDTAVTHTRRARRLALECLAEVRRSVGALRATTPDELSLPHALRKLADEFSEGTGLIVRLELGLDDERLAPEVQLALFRAAQEGLTNVVRHARASEVSVALDREDESVALTVRDDGVGPGESEEAAPAGFGLRGLQERVALLGGRLTFGPAAQQGSQLEVVLPVGSST
jgi:signal transduction histidine kinase